MFGKDTFAEYIMISFILFVVEVITQLEENSIPRDW